MSTGEKINDSSCCIIIFLCIAIDETSAETHHEVLRDICDVIIGMLGNKENWNVTKVALIVSTEKPSLSRVTSAAMTKQVVMSGL